MEGLLTLFPVLPFKFLSPFPLPLPAVFILSQRPHAWIRQLKELQRKQERAREAKETGVNVDVESRPSSPVGGGSTAKYSGDSDDVRGLRAEVLLPSLARSSSRSSCLRSGDGVRAGQTDRRGWRLSPYNENENEDWNE